MNAPADANASRGNICVVWGWVAAFVWSGRPARGVPSHPTTFRQQGAVKRGRDTRQPRRTPLPRRLVAQKCAASSSLRNSLSSSPARRAYTDATWAASSTLRVVTSCRPLKVPHLRARDDAPRHVDLTASLAAKLARVCHAARGSGSACESDGDDSDGQGAPQGGGGVQITTVRSGNFAGFKV